MKGSLWLALVPLTAFWLFSVDVYGFAPEPQVAILSVLIGIALSSMGFIGTEIELDLRYAGFALPLALSCFVVPYPYSAGLMLMASALIASLFGIVTPLRNTTRQESIRLRRNIGLKRNSTQQENIGLQENITLPKIVTLSEGVKSLWLGTIFSGTVLAVGALVLALYYIVAPSHHDAGLLSPLVAFLSNMTGLDATSSGGMLFVYGLGRTFPFSVTFEKLGFYPWILIFGGAIALTCLTSPNALKASKRLLGLAAISVLYLALRFVFILHVFFATDMSRFPAEKMDIFASPIWLLASFLPLVLIFARLYPQAPSNLKLNFRLNMNRRSAIAFAALFVSAFCLIGAPLFQDPGVEKEGRVLVDEIHSVWEFSTLKLDKEWYGTNSTYNAYSMIEWLDESYDVERVVGPSYENWKVPGASKVEPDLVSEMITPEILEDYDILIVKTPSRYEPEEVDAIIDFVEKGGGLFLIGDHTNFAGSGTSLNEISKRFGVEFGFDSVNARDGTLYYHERGALTHLCVKYMPQLNFMTGCSIKAPLGAEPVILGFGMNAVPGEYSSTGFFRETRRNDPTQVTDTTWGLIYQAVALKHGKGRVVAFSDSTIISNFRIFFGGTSNLVAGCMEYLNCSNRYEHVRPVLILLGFVFGAFAIYFIRSGNFLGERRVATSVAILALCALGASCALAAFSAEEEYSIPSHFYIKDHTVCFDGSHSDQVVSVQGERGDYETFFIWIQRLSLVPSVENSLNEAMEKGRILAIIDPVENFTKAEILSIQSYVEEGNSVLLMLDSEGTGKGLIQAFGMETCNETQPSGDLPSGAQNLSDEEGKIRASGLPIRPWGLTIKGGNALLSAENRTVLAETSRGQGKFVLFTESHMFKDGVGGRPGYMGNPKSDPKAMRNLGYDAMALYDLEFRLFEEVLKAGTSLPERNG